MEYFWLYQQTKLLYKKWLTIHLEKKNGLSSDSFSYIKSISKEKTTCLVMPGRCRIVLSCDLCKTHMRDHNNQQNNPHLLREWQSQFIQNKSFHKTAQACGYCLYERILFIIFACNEFLQRRPCSTCIVNISI